MRAKVDKDRVVAKAARSEHARLARLVSDMRRSAARRQLGKKVIPVGASAKISGGLTCLVPLPHRPVTEMQ